MTRFLTAFALALAACQAAPGERVCEVTSATAEVRAADRKILGAGADYEPDGALRGREAELRASERARREVAWRTVEKVVAPVQLAELPAQVPAWQTWYGKDDLDRLFKHLYEDLGADGRRARRSFTDAELDDAFGWNVAAVDELDNWPVERWQDYVASLDEAAEIAGIGGTEPVGYSPSAARHVLASYPDILECVRSGFPPAFVDSPGAATRRALREPVALARCSARSFGPYFASGDERLRATLDAAAGGEVVVRDEQGGAHCRADAGEPCEVAGPGVFYIEVASGTGAVTGALDVDYAEATPAWAPCLAGAFPLDAVVTKAAWRRADFGMTLPTYDTGVPRPDDDWGPGDGAADPGPDAIYTQRTPGGATYRLAALHIMTKELDHWLWITLWWSPDRDSDNPLDGVWRSYKMCAVTAFDDPDGAATRCSNPYLELGPGNAATNCIGCHQHGFTGARAEDVIGDLRQVRNNFPGDYSWAVDAGDRLGVMFANVVDYYDSFE